MYAYARAIPHKMNEIQPINVIQSLNLIHSLNDSTTSKFRSDTQEAADNVPIDWHKHTLECTFLEIFAGPDRKTTCRITSIGPFLP